MALHPSRIDHLLLIVDDLEASIAFYEGVIGARLQARLPEFGMAELAVGSKMIDLVDISAVNGGWASPTTPGGRNVDHFCVALESLRETDFRGHLDHLGVAVVEEQPHGSAALSLYVRDPSGNVVELKAVLAPA